MRHTARALRLIIVVLWIAVLLLPVTVALSLLEIFEARNNVGIGEPSFSVSDENFSISMPFYMNNTCFYDISELYVKIRICYKNGEIIEFSTQPLDIPAGRMVESNLSASVSLTDALTKGLELLTNSTDLNIDVSLHFRVANVLAFNVAKNFTYRWDAPFSNLTISQVSFNLTHASFQVSFFNNASFPLSGGPLKLELYNSSNVLLYSTELSLNVPPKEPYAKLFEIPVFGLTPDGIIRLYFADVLIFEKRWGLHERS